MPDRIKKVLTTFQEQSISDALTKYQSRQYSNLKIKFATGKLVSPIKIEYSRETPKSASLATWETAEVESIIVIDFREDFFLCGPDNGPPFAQNVMIRFAEREFKSVRSFSDYLLKKNMFADKRSLEERVKEAVEEKRIQLVEAASRRNKKPSLLLLAKIPSRVADILDWSYRVAFLICGTIFFIFSIAALWRIVGQ